MTDDNFRRNPQDEDLYAYDDLDQPSGDLGEETYDENYADMDDAPTDEQENWDAYADDTTGTAAGEGEPQKKRPSLLTMLLVGGAVAVCGLFLLTQFGGNKDQAVPADPAAGVVAQSDSLPDSGVTDRSGATGMNVANAGLAPQGGGLNSPADGVNGDMASNASPPPMPNSFMKADAPADVLTPLPGDSAIAQSVPPAPEPPTPVASASLAPVGAPVEQAAALPAPVVEAPASPPAPAQNPSAENAVLIQRLDEIMSRLQSLETRLGSLEQDRAAPSAADNGDLRAAVDSLRNRLDQVEAQPRSTQQPAGAAVQADSAPVKQMKPATRRAARPASTEPEKSATRWVLKSAQPGQAYISRPGQNDMFSVRVGDTMAGLGTVQSIAVEQGRWIIRGTDGQVSQ